MARIKQLTDVTDIDEEFHHIVKEIIGSRGRISGPFQFFYTALKSLVEPHTLVSL